MGAIIQQVERVKILNLHQGPSCEGTERLALLKQSTTAKISSCLTSNFVRLFCTYPSDECQGLRELLPDYWYLLVFASYTAS